MPRPRLPDDEKKHTLNVSIKGKLKRRLQLHGNYSRLIEKMVEEYFDKIDKK